MNIHDWGKQNCHSTLTSRLTNKDICDKFINSYINWMLRCVKDSHNKKIILKLTESTLSHRHKVYKLIYELSRDKSKYLSKPHVQRGISLK